MLKRILKTDILLLLVFLLVVAALVIYEYQEYRLAKEEVSVFVSVHQRSVNGLSLLSKMRKGADYVQVATLRYLQAATPKEKKREKELIDRETAINDSNILAFGQILDAGDQYLLNGLKDLRVQNKQFRDQILALAETPGSEDALKHLLKEQDIAYEHFQEATGELIESFTSNMLRDENLFAGQINEIERRKLGIGALFLTLLLAGSFYVRKTIVKINRLNRSLKQAKTNYRNLVENTDELITRCDAEGWLIYANEPFLKKMGYAGIKGLHLRDIIADDSLPQYDPNPTEEKFGRRIKNQSWIYKTRKGRKLFVEGNIVLDFDNGRFKGAAAFFRDVTEKVTLEKALRASEKKYRILFDLSPLPKYYIDPETYRILDANVAAQQLYGYSRAELARMTGFELRRASEEQITRLKQVSEAMKDNSGGIVSQESVHYKKNGEPVDVEISWNLVDLGDKDVYMVVARDLTEKKKLEREVTKAIIKAQEDERYLIGTELHDNVCQIIASTQLVLGIMKSHVHKDAFRWWETATRNTEMAMKEIRTLSHQLAPVFLEDTSFIESVQRLFRDMNAGNRFTEKVVFDSSAEILANHQELQLNLYRILQEQLKNIIKYADASLVKVSLFSRQSKLIMEVSDDGNGFNPDAVQKGIGLKNIAKRAEMFEGRLFVDSAPGKGCRLRVEIPLSNMN